jgi:hypothetical protein
MHYTFWQNLSLWEGNQSDENIVWTSFKGLLGPMSQLKGLSLWSCKFKRYQVDVKDIQCPL